jgi:hypothetical protein
MSLSLMFLPYKDKAKMKEYMEWIMESVEIDSGMSMEKALSIIKDNLRSKA